jgi:hypothetical protein
MSVPEAVDPVGQSTSAIARLLATDMRDDLLAIMREILEHNAFAERLAYSPTKPLNYWASPGNPSTTCSIPVNSGQ